MTMARLNLPILYSFRRCPYAMRARMSIVRSNYLCEHREVILRDRPDHMMGDFTKVHRPSIVASRRDSNRGEPRNYATCVGLGTGCDGSLMG